MVKIFIISIFLLTCICPAAMAKDYWQQEVNYLIEVTLREDLRTIDGYIEIEYINNSPDTLSVLYLKAFPNAVQKGSYADEKMRRMNSYDYAELKPEEEGSLELFIPEEMSYEKLGYDEFEFDNTIVTVYLSRPLAPDDTVYLTFDFRTILPRPARARMGFERGVTKTAYWFPQVCVYDYKLGWVNGQYLFWGECYGDFGLYDVYITAPEDQVVAATGELVNEKEVLPDSLRQMLDIKNFLKPRDQQPRFDFENGKTKTWHYIAEDVNDFVFTSSNQFCIDSGSVNGVKVVAYPLRHKAKSWVDAVRLGREAIQTYSELYYPYQWPVIRICDAYSGMEFPMLTNCGGGGPNHHWSMLLYHEIGHQWFMGQVGFNQVDRPFLDEGFTTHAEHVIMEKYYGREGNMDDFTGWYEKKFAPPTEDRNVRGFQPLLTLMKTGFDKPMIFSYDRGEEYWPYRVSAYYKSAALHYALRSILGDSTYFDVMFRFCDEWFFAHPYEDDLRESLELSTGLQLDEYLQQWYYGRERLDYAYAGKKTREVDYYYFHTIKLKRPGDFISPVDIAIIYDQGDTSFYTVAPEGMGFAKSGFALLPTWDQFRRFSDRYEFTVRSQRDIKKVVLDPHNLLVDIERRNNQSGLFWPTEIRLDNMKYDRTPVDKYKLRWRPDFWYDEPNSVQAGLHAHGSYLDIEDKFNLDVRLGTESGRPFVDALYSTPFRPFGYNSINEMRYLRSDYRTFFSQINEKIFKRYYSREDRELFRMELSYLNVAGEQKNRFEPIPDKIIEYLPNTMWDINQTCYAVMETGLLRTFRYGKYVFNIKNVLGGYDEDDRLRGFDQMELSWDLYLNFKKRPNLKLTFNLLNTGGEPPSQFLHHLSRVSEAERFINSKVFRSPGTFPADWEDDFFLANGRVRGYQDRMVYLTSSFGGSAELTVPDLLPYKWFKVIPVVGGFLSRIDQKFFVDLASVSMDNKEKYYPMLDTANETALYSDERIFYLSTGVSVTLPPVWSQHRVRLDFPLYLNKPVTDEEEFEFRFSVAWLLPE
ncbi:MAG: M1 family metallopeptidase [candidate division Zixibacteria bacterium]|nr:M1 family metallopeptidase [candidate division Zixibacteria bacterium]